MKFFFLVLYFGCVFCGAMRSIWDDFFRGSIIRNWFSRDRTYRNFALRIFFYRFYLFRWLLFTSFGLNEVNNSQRKTIWTLSSFLVNIFFFYKKIRHHWKFGNITFYDYIIFFFVCVFWLYILWRYAKYLRLLFRGIIWNWFSRDRNDRNFALRFFTVFIFENLWLRNERSWT